MREKLARRGAGALLAGVALAAGVKRVLGAKHPHIMKNRAVPGDGQRYRLRSLWGERPVFAEVVGKRHAVGRKVVCRDADGCGIERASARARAVTVDNRDLRSVICAFKVHMRLAYPHHLAIYPRTHTNSATLVRQCVHSLLHCAKVPAAISRNHELRLLGVGSFGRLACCCFGKRYEYIFLASGRFTVSWQVGQLNVFAAWNEAHAPGSAAEVPMLPPNLCLIQSVHPPA